MVWAVGLTHSGRAGVIEMKTDDSLNINDASYCVQERYSIFTLPAHNVTQFFIKRSLNELIRSNKKLIFINILHLDDMT